MTVMSMVPILWLGMILAAIFAEAAFQGLRAVWCAPAALAALICGAAGMQVWEQTVVFAGTAAGLIAIAQIVRRFVRR